MGSCLVFSFLWLRTKYVRYFMVIWWMFFIVFFCFFFQVFGVCANSLVVQCCMYVWSWRKLAIMIMSRFIVHPCALIAIIRGLYLSCLVFMSCVNVTSIIWTARLGAGKNGLDCSCVGPLYAHYVFAYSCWTNASSCLAFTSIVGAMVRWCYLGGGLLCYRHLWV